MMRYIGHNKWTISWGMSIMGEAGQAGRRFPIYLLPEGQTYLSLLLKLGGHMLPVGIPATDVEGRELSHRERYTFPRAL